MPRKYTDEMAHTDLRLCQQMLRGGSRSFHLASRVLPRQWRAPATALYAFCRMADDAVDQSRDPHAALTDLHARLDALYAGEPRDFAVDRAFGACVEAHAIPKLLPLSLLEGFAWDAQGRTYQDLADLETYAVRVAGTVGMMLALILGARDRETLQRACELGLAMQLTNIARDVGEDARLGRLYLPADLLLQAGIRPDLFLRAPRHREALKDCIEILLRRAAVLYRDSAAGIAQLPRRCRPAMYAASFLYAAIGEEVRRNHCNAIDQRAVVPGWRKLQHVTAACAASAVTVRLVETCAPAAAEFLLQSFEPRDARARPGRPTGTGRVEWLIGLFERLEGSDSVSA